MDRRIGMPRRRAVSKTDLTSAQSLAPHSERKQFVTLRKMTQGRRACSEPLLVGGTSRLVTKTNRFCPEPLDDPLQLLPLAVLGGDLEQLIKPHLKLVRIDGKRHLGEPLAPSADGDGLLQQLLDAWGEGVVTGVDGVLDVAQQMGEADLMVLVGPSHLGPETVRDPDVGT